MQRKRSNKFYAALGFMSVMLALATMTPMPATAESTQPQPLVLSGGWQLQDAAKTLPDGKPGPTSPVTVVRAQKLVYNDTNRLAIYSGDVSMVRAGLTVKCATLQAYMNDGKPVDGKTPDSRIDRALADGKVEVLQVALARQRIGTSEHGEYYTEEGKIVLTGGRPHVKDSKTGDSTGENLTYFTNDDRIVIDGSPKKIVEGHIVRGKS